MKTYTKSSTKFAYRMITPTVIILAVMTVYPLVFTFGYSFTDFNILKRNNVNIVKLENYFSLVKNEYFLKSIWTTVKFTVIATVLEMAVGFIMAIYVNSLKFGQKIMRTVLLLPYLLPAVTVALIFRMMLSNNYGIVNQFLTTLGLPVYNWFSDIKTAFGMIVLIDVWQNAPFVFLLLYASMQAVSKDQYEAAKIDGANAFKIVRYITVPNIANSLFLCALLRVIDSFRLFEKVNILTGGGPANSTTTITQYLYSYGITQLKFGLTSSGAIIMTVIVLLLSSFYIKRQIN